MDPACLQVMAHGEISGPFAGMSGDYVSEPTIYIDQLLELEPNEFTLGTLKVDEPNFTVNGLTNYSVQVMLNVTLDLEGRTGPITIDLDLNPSISRDIVVKGDVNFTKRTDYHDLTIKNY